MPSPETCGAQVLAAAAGATPTPDPCQRKITKRTLESTLMQEPLECVAELVE
jgi:hypothetical protein